MSVGRLVSYKQPETLVDLFNELDLPLVIIGSGSEEKKLKAKAKSHIKILGHVSETELIHHYQKAKALISLHEEDFGLVYAEAQAAGKPVLALNTGGVREIVEHNKTGYLANNLEELKSAIINFSPQQFNHLTIKQSSSRFSKERFKTEFVKVFNQEYLKYQSRL